MNWYEKYIEKPIRPLVKLLRDNGYNTECSCGHKMYVQCQYPWIDNGEFYRLDMLLFNNGYRDYKIETWIKRVDGNLVSSGFDVKLSGFEPCGSI
jgi:hypothetical protein